MKLQMKIWITLILFFVLNQLFENFGGRILFLYSYLDDFLFFPIILTLILIIQQHIFNKEYIFPTQYIIFTFTILSLLVEFIYPKISSKFTFDHFDFIAYFVGTIFFSLFLNKKSLI